MEIPRVVRNLGRGFAYGTHDGLMFKIPSSYQGERMILENKNRNFSLARLGYGLGISTAALGYMAAAVATVQILHLVI